MFSVNPNDINKIDIISKRVEGIKHTIDMDLLSIYEMEELFDEIYGIFKLRINKDT